VVKCPSQQYGITGRGTSTVRARVRVSGRVQGVFFRAETQSRARSLSLTGWVRNAPDGTVEAVFEGPSERVRSMLEWCRRGPNYAEVDDVTVGWEEPQGEDEFRIR
jgi:acylphosphatase